MKSITKIVYFILITIEVVIMLRFTFLLLGANEKNILVKYVIDYSDFLVTPFKGILDSDWNIGKFFVEVDSLVSLLIYMILGFGLSQLVKMFSYS
jgi:hypothetical protein